MNPGRRVSIRRKRSVRKTSRRKDVKSRRRARRVDSRRISRSKVRNRTRSRRKRSSRKRSSRKRSSRRRSLRRRNQRGGTYLKLDGDCNALEDNCWVNARLSIENGVVKEVYISRNMDKGKPDALNEDIMVKKDGNKWDLDKGHKEKWVRSEANRLYESRDDDVKGLLVNLYVMASEKENEYIEVRNKLRDTPAYYDKLSPALMTNLREQTKIKEEYVVFANKLIEKLSGDDPDLRGFWIDIGNKGDFYNFK